MNLFDLTLSFFKIGIMGFGGGSAVAPYIHKEFVEKHKFLTEDEFLDILSIANLLPGPSMAQMASSIGYKYKKWIGSILATSAIIIPMSVFFAIVMITLNSLINPDYLNTVFTPVLAVVSAIMLSLAKRIYISIHSSHSNMFIFSIILVSFILIYFLGIHPSLVIVSMILIVLLFTREESHD